MPTIRLFPAVYYNPSRIPNPGPLVADAADWQPLDSRNVASGRADRDSPALEPENRIRSGDARDPSGPSVRRLFSDWSGTAAGEWLARGILVQDPAPALYLYRATRPVPQEVRGVPGIPERASCLAVVAALGLDGNGPLKAGEALASDRVERMVPVMKAFALDVAPVWALFQAASAGAHRPRMDELVAEAQQGAPVLAFETDDGGAHRVWRVEADRASELAALLGGLPMAAFQGCVQLAALGRLAARGGAGHRPEAGPPSLLAFLTPADADPASGQSPVLLPVHRLLLSTTRISGEQLLERLAPAFRVWEVGPAGDADGAAGAALEQVARVRGEFNGFALYLGRGRAFAVRSKGRMFMESWSHPLGRPAWRALDVNVLHTLVFERALGLGAEASRSSAPPLATELSLRRAVQRVDAGEAVAAFLLLPPSPAQLLAAALENNPVPADAVRPWPPVPAGVLLRWRREP